MAKIEMMGRQYDLVYGDATYAARIAAGERCAILVTYRDFGETYRAAATAITEAGGNIQQGLNPEVHLWVVCESCQRSLNPQGIWTLLRSQLSGAKKITSIRGPVKVDACPNCGHPRCYVMYDPQGFQHPRIEEAAYLCYADFADAKRAFELIKQRISQKGSELPARGVVELRTEEQTPGLPFPHWVVIHTQEAPPGGFYDEFVHTLDLSGELDYDESDLRRKPESIEANRRRTELRESVEF